MKKLLLIVCSFFVMSAKSMENEMLNSAVGCSFPEELTIFIKHEHKKHDTIVYFFSGSSDWCIPYSLRSIDPVRWTYEGQINVDLITPDPEKSIFLDPQLWNEGGNLFGLRLIRAHTKDCFRKTVSSFSPEERLFDGINNHRLAIAADLNEKQHKLYVLHQSPDNAGMITHPGYLEPIMLENGYLRSLLLHRETNRCVRGIKNMYTNTDKSHCISIGDICTIEDTNADTYKSIASLATHFVLRKAVYLGKNTYLGLTEEGDMISFWLNDHNQLECALQGCNGKKFKDIDVDETVQSKTGFMPRVGLLGTNGDVYLIDLRREKPILLYTRTLEKPDNICRFFYDKGKCAVVYKKGNSYKTFHVWPDGFDCALVCMSLKYGQAEAF